MKLLFLGDLFYDYDYITEDMEEIISFIKENDYKVVVNLETALFEKDKPIKKRGPNLKSSLTVIEILKKMDCVCVCMANNHTMDYGGKSLLAGIEELDKNQITHVGAGTNIKDAGNPLILETNGEKIIFQNFGWDVEETVYATVSTPGCNPLLPHFVVNNTEKLRKKYPEAFLINVFHWGFEFNTLPMPIDVNLARKCVDAGADLIIGHHPHVVQPFENYRGKEIFYSLGNFFFASRRDTFIHKFKDEKYENMCDFGIGVVYNTTERSYKCIQFEYKSKDKKTILHKDLTCLDDLTGVDCTTEEYLARAKQHSSSYNPILGLNEKYNQQALKKLFFRYSVSKQLAFLKNNKLGKVAYGFLKKISNLMC